MSLFDRVLAQQMAVCAVQIPAGNGASPAAGALNDGLYGNQDGPWPSQIYARDVPGSLGAPMEELRKLKRGYIVLHPRFRIQVAHLGAPSGYQYAYLMDDTIIYHLPASQAHPENEVDTILPADWQTHFPTFPAGGSGSPQTHTTYMPVYTRWPAWKGYGTGFWWTHAANLCMLGTPFYTSVKSQVVAPRAVDTLRKQFCIPGTFDPNGSTSQWNIFNGVGSGTPVWMLVQEPGKTHSTVVRLGAVFWSGGYFEWIHAGLTNLAGRHNPNETRSLSQIMNALATATGDDPMAGSYDWPAMAKTVNLSETLIAPPAFPVNVADVNRNVGGVIISLGKRVTPKPAKPKIEYTVAAVDENIGGVVINEGK